MTILDHKQRTLMKDALKKNLEAKYKFSYFITLSPSVDSSKNQINDAMTTLIHMLNQRTGIRKRKDGSYSSGHINGFAVLEQNTAGRYHVHILIDANSEFGAKPLDKVRAIVLDATKRLVIGKRRRPLFSQHACDVQQLPDEADRMGATDYCLKSLNRPSAVGADFFTYIDHKGFMSFC